MSDAVLDSSALLAAILEEPGADAVEALLPGAKMSAVNLGEVAAKLGELGMPEATVETVLGGLQIDVRIHDWVPPWRQAFFARRPAAPDCRSGIARVWRSLPHSVCPLSRRIAAGRAWPRRSA